MMKIMVEFLSVPNVVKIIGSKTLEFDFSKNTITELIDEIVKKYGQQVGRFLLDSSGQLDPAFQLMLNQQEWIHQEQRNRTLKDGDRLTIMMLVGGG